MFTQRRRRMIRIRNNITVNGSVLPSVHVFETSCREKKYQPPGLLLMTQLSKVTSKFYWTVIVSLQSTCKFDTMCPWFPDLWLILLQVLLANGPKLHCYPQTNILKTSGVVEVIIVVQYVSLYLCAYAHLDIYRRGTHHRKLKVSNWVHGNILQEYPQFELCIFRFMLDKMLIAKQFIGAITKKISVLHS